MFLHFVDNPKIRVFIFGFVVNLSNLKEQPTISDSSHRGHIGCPYYAASIRASSMSSTSPPTQPATQPATGLQPVQRRVQRRSTVIAIRHLTTRLRTTHSDRLQQPTIRMTIFSCLNHFE